MILLAVASSHAALQPSYVMTPGGSLQSTVGVLRPAKGFQW
jgi:hypothetical protein